MMMTMKRILTGENLTNSGEIGKERNAGQKKALAENDSGG